MEKWWKRIEKRAKQAKIEKKINGGKDVEERKKNVWKTVNLLLIWITLAFCIVFGWCQNCFKTESIKLLNVCHISRWFFFVRLMYDGNEHQFKWNEINIDIFFEHVIFNPLNRIGAYNAYNNIRFSLFFPIKMILIHNMLLARRR